jgi:acyl carrier protein
MVGDRFCMHLAELPAFAKNLFMFRCQTPPAGDGHPQGGSPARRAISGIYPRDIKGLVMSSTFDQVATIIAETCDIPRDTITPDSHAIDDLGIDSLDFLDIAFAIDKAFGIKLPLEKWTQEVNDGKATTEQYFVLKNLCARIDGLVTAKNEGASVAVLRAAATDGLSGVCAPS